MGERFQAHVQAVKNAAAKRVSTRASIESSVGVLHDRCFGIYPVDAAGRRAEVVENGLLACGGDLEDRSVVILSAHGSCPVKIAIGSQGQARVGIGPVGISGEAVEHLLGTRASDFEHCSAATAATCGSTAVIGCSVEIAVIALHQNSDWHGSVVAVKPFKGPEYGPLAVGSHLVHHSAAILVAFAGWLSAEYRSAIKIVIAPLGGKVGVRAVAE